MVFNSSNKKFIFDCDVCHHEFLSSVWHITGRNVWCPFCASHKLCDDECTYCFNKSFASHPRSEFWSDKNNILPRNVFKFSRHKFYFDCEDCGHQFKSDLSNVNKGTWCPKCKNKTEKKLYDWLGGEYDNVKFQKKYDWCKNINRLPYDFVLKDYDIIIELDGPQHFRQISNWNDPEETHKRDLFKMRKANKNGFSVIRILQENVWDDSIKWKKLLAKKIKINKKPRNMFICDGDQYDNFMDS